MLIWMLVLKSMHDVYLQLLQPVAKSMASLASRSLCLYSERYDFCISIADQAQDQAWIVHGFDQCTAMSVTHPKKTTSFITAHAELDQGLIKHCSPDCCCIACRLHILFRRKLSTMLSYLQVPCYAIHISYCPGIMYMYPNPYLNFE